MLKPASRFRVWVWVLVHGIFVLRGVAKLLEVVLEEHVCSIEEVGEVAQIDRDQNVDEGSIWDHFA